MADLSNKFVTKIAEKSSYGSKRFRAFDIGGSGTKSCLIDIQQDGSYTIADNSYISIPPVDPESIYSNVIRQNIDSFDDEIKENYDIFISSAGDIDIRNKSIKDDWKGGGIPRKKKDWNGKKSYKFSEIFEIPAEYEKNVYVLPDTLSHTYGIIYTHGKKLEDGIYCNIALGTGVVITIFQKCNSNYRIITPHILEQSTLIPLSLDGSDDSKIQIWDFLGNGYDNGHPYGLKTIYPEAKRGPEANIRTKYLIKYIQQKIKKDITSFIITGGTSNLLQQFESINKSNIIIDKTPGISMIGYNLLKHNITFTEGTIIECRSNKNNKKVGGDVKRKSNRTSYTKRKIRKLNKKSTTKKNKRYINKKGGVRSNNIIVNLNLAFIPENMMFDSIYEKTREQLSSHGCLFNPTVYEYDHNTLIGLARFCYMEGAESDDIVINGRFTTTANRHPYSFGSPWRTGWSRAVTDECIFFVLKDGGEGNDSIKFYTLNNNLNFGPTQYTPRIEDPRITKLNDIYVLYGHVSHLDRNAVGVIGTDRDRELELKPPERIAEHFTLPVLSYVNVRFIEHIINHNNDRIPIQNSNWKLACKNWLPYGTEKNFAMIPRPNMDRLDLIYSLGGYTDSLVMIHVNKADLQGNAEHCGYVESLTGRTRSSGQGIIPYNILHVPSNAIFKTMRDTINIQSIAYGRALLSSINVNNIRRLSNYIFSISYIDNNRFRITFLRNCNNAEMDIGLDDLKILDQISSGGPSAIKVNNDNSFSRNEVVSVGHLKILWRPLIVLIHLAQAFPEIANTFRDILLAENSIFMYYYNFISTQNPLLVWGRSRMNQAIEVSENQNVLHQNRAYSSFLYVLNLDNYAITVITKQFFVENQTLEFCDTIANHTSSDGNKGYILPYGCNDVQAKLYICTKEHIDHLILNESQFPAGENKPPLECVNLFTKVANITTVLNRGQNARPRVVAPRGVEQGVAQHRLDDRRRVGNLRLAQQGQLEQQRVEEQQRRLERERHLQQRLDQQLVDQQRLQQRIEQQNVDRQQLEQSLQECLQQHAPQQHVAQQPQPPALQFPFAPALEIGQLAQQHAAQQQPAQGAFHFGMTPAQAAQFAVKEFRR